MFMGTRPFARPLALALLALAVAWLLPGAVAQAPDDLPRYIRENYTRHDYRIPMRDGVHLYTVVYAPKDAAQKYPLLIRRTPYGSGPYEKDQFPRSLGPNKYFAAEGYIFVSQDVRGCYLSEG